MSRPNVFSGFSFEDSVSGLSTNYGYLFSFYADSSNNAADGASIALVCSGNFGYSTGFGGGGAG